MLVARVVWLCPASISTVSPGSTRPSRFRIVSPCTIISSVVATNVACTGPTPHHTPGRGEVAGWWGGGRGGHGGGERGGHARGRARRGEGHDQPAVQLLGHGAGHPG